MHRFSENTKKVLPKLSEPITGKAQILIITVAYTCICIKKHIKLPFLKDTVKQLENTQSVMSIGFLLSIIALHMPYHSQQLEVPLDQ